VLAVDTGADIIINGGTMAARVSSTLFIGSKLSNAGTLAASGGLIDCASTVTGGKALQDDKVPWPGIHLSPAQGDDRNGLAIKSNLARTFGAAGSLSLRFEINEYRIHKRNVTLEGAYLGLSDILTLG
jgi:hypothetical protein